MNSKEHLYALLKGFDTAMMITCADGAQMHARPMAVAELLSDGRAYFPTNADSPQVDEIQSHATTYCFCATTRPSALTKTRYRSPDLHEAM